MKLGDAETEVEDVLEGDAVGDAAMHVGASALQTPDKGLQVAVTGSPTYPSAQYMRIAAGARVVPLVMLILTLGSTIGTSQPVQVGQVPFQ